MTINKQKHFIVLFCWLVDVDVMKWACSLSATALPSVISWWDKSLEKNALAPPASVIAKICIGMLEIFIEKALEGKEPRNIQSLKSKLKCHMHEFNYNHLFEFQATNFDVFRFLGFRIKPYLEASRHWQGYKPQRCLRGKDTWDQISKILLNRNYNC